MTRKQRIVNRMTKAYINNHLTFGIECESFTKARKTIKWCLKHSMEG